MSELELVRILKPGIPPGTDVRAIRRGCLKITGKPASHLTRTQQCVFGDAMTTIIKDAQDECAIPKSGWGGNRLLGLLLNANVIDAAGKKDLRDYAAKHGPVVITLKPRSLHRSLWPVYNDALNNYDFSNLGTYNPKSKLPSGAPSDHSVYPAYAADFGIDPDTGHRNAKALEFVKKWADDDAIEYIILGDRIYFSSTHYERYGSGGHMNHIHVSGIR